MNRTIAFALVLILIFVSLCMYGIASASQNVCTVVRSSSNDSITSVIINCKPETSFENGSLIIVNDFKAGDMKPVKVYKRYTTPMIIEGC